MSCNKVSMSNVMQVYSEIVLMENNAPPGVSRADVARNLENIMCRATCYWAFDVLYEAGLLCEMGTRGRFETKVGRPPRRFTLQWPFAPSKYSVAVLRVENYYIRRANVTS